MPELGTWERFCVDEVCAYVYALEQKRLMEEKQAAQQAREAQKAVENPLAWMTQPRFMSE